MCSVTDCESKNYGLGFCRKHYMRNRRYGNPLAGGTFVGSPLAFLKASLLVETEDCIIWPFAYAGDREHYPRIAAENGGSPDAVTRIVCTETYGKPPSAEYEAAHSCRVTMCINKKHLRWATPAENQGDRLDHGTMLYGSNSPNAKISDDEARSIKVSRGKVPSKDIAKKYGMSVANINAIQSGRRWAWL